jgi:hypothetical protein
MPGYSLLTQYTNNPEHGDNPSGARIEQCKNGAMNIKAQPEVLC